MCAWLLASGALWDVVQIGAWTRMWIDNVRTQSATAALAATFSAEAMCGVCRTVQAAKRGAREDQPASLPLLDKAPLLPLRESGLRVVPPAASGWWRAFEAVYRAGDPPVPLLPPPRMAWA